MNKKMQIEKELLLKRRENLFRLIREKGVKSAKVRRKFLALRRDTQIYLSKL